MDRNQEKKQNDLAALLEPAVVLPVVTVNEPRLAVSLAKALHRGGLPAIELTLRSDEALGCLQAIAREVPELIPGAGTVITAAQVEACEAAGAQFLVSPGTSEAMLEAAEQSPLPLLPGVATASEVMRLGERGYRHMKLFPAAQSGGPGWLKSVSGPLPQYRFCPTGGVTLDNAGDWLALPNVICVGGSWIAPAALINAEAFDQIEENARRASALGRG